MGERCSTDAPETLPAHFDALRYHGGNLDAARLRFPNAPLPWIDLSTGINPLPYPIGGIPADAWARLPEASAQAALETAARRAYGVHCLADVVAVPGTQALLQWLPRVVPARSVGILGFSYGEHEKCWREAEADVTTVESPGELAAFDAGVVVNPNNPDGRWVRPDVLLAAAESLAQKNGLLIVDEAFMDVLDARASLVPCLPASGAIVLRSFGKVYGLAGLRLGFAIGSPELCASLRGVFGPWSVSGPAIEVGCRALTDAVWLAETKSRLNDAAERLDRLLQPAGFTIAGGSTLFRLVSHGEAAWWFEHLARYGILTRPFAGKPGWLRFGLPGVQAEWERLEAALRSR